MPTRHPACPAQARPNTPVTNHYMLQHFIVRRHPFLLFLAFLASFLPAQPRHGRRPAPLRRPRPPPGHKASRCQGHRYPGGFRQSPQWSTVGQAMASELTRQQLYPEVDERVIGLWPLLGEDGSPRNCPLLPPPRAVIGSPGCDRSRDCWFPADWCKSSK